MTDTPAAGGGRDPDRLLRHAGVVGDPGRDQHFLVDDRVLERIAGYAAELDVGDGPILEVGPGTGALTDRLLSIAPVVAIERDRRLVGFLEGEFADSIDRGRLDLRAGDALEAALPDFAASVSNLPYGITSPLLFRLLPRSRPIVVTVQREVADRLVADPGTPEYGRLAVTAGHFARAELLEVVPPAAFAPPPPVESAVVRLLPREPPYELADVDAFMDLVRALFTQRRKTLRNAVRNTTHLSGIDRPDAVLDRLPAGWTDRRPGTLSPAEFARIARLAVEEGTDR